MSAQYNSLINPSAKIDINQWGITLVADHAQGINILNVCHAKLYFEGFNKENEYFIQQAHLKGSNERNSLWRNVNLLAQNKIGTVHLGREIRRENFEINFTKKTQTWVTTKEKISNLIATIESESKKPYPFVFCGSQSVFAKEVETYNIYSPLLSEIGVINKNLFLKLYDSAENECKCTGMTEEEFNKSINETIESIRKSKSNLLEPKKEYNYKCLVELFKDDLVKQEKILQQSCFTWAKKHLKSIGVDLEDFPCNKCISITRLSTTLFIEDDQVIYLEQTTNDGKIVAIDDKKKLLDRVVTYKSDRDRRTESYKEISSNIKKNEIGRTAGIVTTAVGVTGFWGGVFGSVACAFGAVAAAPFVLPAVATVGVLGGVSAMAGGIFIASKSSGNLVEISKKEDIKGAITSAEFERFQNTVEPFKKYERKSSAIKPEIVKLMEKDIEDQLDILFASKK